MSKHEGRTSLLSGSDVDYNYQPYAGGGYAAREGLQPATTYGRGERRSCLSIFNTKWTRTFAGIAVAQAIVAICIEAWIFVKFQTALKPEHAKSLSSTVTTYLSLFIFGFIYQLCLVFDALRLKNTIQVIGLCLYNVGLLIEAAVQKDQFNDALNLAKDPNYQPEDSPKYSGADQLDPKFLGNVNPLVIALPCILGLGTVLLAFVTFKLYEEFSWSIYKNISADLRLKHRFLSYQIYIALLKFDFFFFLAFTVQFLVVVINFRDPEFWITLAAIPITVLLLFLAGYWTRKESIVGMLLIILCYFGGLAYFLFKLVRMYFDPDIQRRQQYLPTRRSLTTFAIITVLLLLVTIAYAILCTINFNKGLKPHLESGGESRRRRNRSQDFDKLFSHDVPLEGTGPGPSQRMTID